MKKIEIEDDIYKYILANIEAFGETPSQILRRLLGLAADENHSDESAVITAPSAAQAVPTVDKQHSQSSTHSLSSLPDAVAHGVAALFEEQTFKKEPVITNKFKMMLTAMYHENRAAFIVAANTTRGRTRDYLGQNLSELLASDNEKEVAQLKASKPREIPYTPFWVITNANTGRKRIILTQMMTSMGYPPHLIERIKDEI
jgi:negative modulator of initiation of replication